MRKALHGQSLVEFALVLPVLLLLTFGIIEFSLLLYDKAVITNASREGARVGIVAQDRTDLVPIRTAIVNTVTNYCQNNLITFGNPIGALQIPAPQFSGTTFGSTLTVTVRYTYGFLVLPNFMSGLAGPTVLEATTVMKLE
jgi:Flp pilus assembly protein TadG